LKERIRSRWRVLGLTRSGEKTRSDEIHDLEAVEGVVNLPRPMMAQG
jgi:hypothetical protein